MTLKPKFLFEVKKNFIAFIFISHSVSVSKEQITKLLLQCEDLCPSTFAVWLANTLYSVDCKKEYHT